MQFLSLQNGKTLVRLAREAVEDFLDKGKLEFQREKGANTGPRD